MPSGNSVPTSSGRSGEGIANRHLNKMQKIDNKLLEGLLSQAAASPRLRMNYDLRNSETDGSQRMLNALQPGTVLPIHRHRATAETVILLRGRIDEVFYDNAGHETARFHLDPSTGSYGLQIPAGQWHSLVALEPSVLFEAKDGPWEPLGVADILISEYNG